MDAAALKHNVHGVKAAFYELSASLRRDLDLQRQESRRLGESLAEVERHRADLTQHRVELERQNVQLQLQRVKLDHLAHRFADLPWDHLRDISQLGRRSIIVARTAAGVLDASGDYRLASSRLCRLAPGASWRSGHTASRNRRTVRTIDIGLVTDAECDAGFPWCGQMAQAILSN